MVVIKLSGHCGRLERDPGRGVEPRWLVDTGEVEADRACSSVDLRLRDRGGRMHREGSFPERKAHQRAHEGLEPRCSWRYRICRNLAGWRDDTRQYRRVNVMRPAPACAPCRR